MLIYSEVLQLNFWSRFSLNLNHESKEGVFHDFCILKSNNKMWCVLFGNGFTFFSSFWNDQQINTSLCKVIFTGLLSRTISWAEHVAESDPLLAFAVYNPESLSLHYTSLILNMKFF